MTQHKTRVLAAILEDGCATSQDVCDVTGLDRNKVTAYLCKFMATGVLTRKPLPRTRPGRMEYFYEVAK